MKRKPDGPKPIKTSISIPRVLMDFAEERVAEEGHSSFSSYLQYLIRADRDREQRKEKSGSKSSESPPKKRRGDNSTAGMTGFD